MAMPISEYVGNQDDEVFRNMMDFN